MARILGIVWLGVWIGGMGGLLLGVEGRIMSRYVRGILTGRYIDRMAVENG